MFTKLSVVALVGQAAAFPWVPAHVGLDAEQVKRSAGTPTKVLEARASGDAASCPFNPTHTPAVPISAKYPYCGAKGGVPGYQVCVNNKVPADGDTAHAWEAPGPNDIRGPCPGLNTAANHHFLSHDGITNFTELVDAQQNVYGVGYDLAVLLATLGVGLDGDPVGTTKLSLGCDATSRTAAVPAAGPELGLDGHNKFEGDTSLTRNDYFLANGDNYDFNMTLYNEMSSYAQGSFNRANIAKYRYQRYQESLHTNGNFYFGPKSLLLFGAASFLYELFPSLGELGTPDQTTMDYFFKKEQIPPNWYSRVDPYTIPLVAAEIFAQYEMYPVAFGANTGAPNTFVGFGQNGPQFIGANSMLSNSTAAGVACALYQVATENDPAEFGGGSIPQTPSANLAWMASKLNPLFTGSGSAASFACPIAFNNA